MEAFTSTVSSQIIRLDGLDALASIFTIPICYWYENSARDSWDTFMPPEILERAFYKTLQELPIFSGHLMADSNSRLYVEVDKDNLNMPVYTDTCCDLDYSAMQETGFNISKLPAGLREEYRVPAPSGLVGGQIKPAHIRIVRFKDNSGVLVFACISHYIFDGYGYAQFMNRWAEVSRWMQQPQDANKAPLPASLFTYDRSIHSSYRSEQTTALDTPMIEAMSTGTAFTKWVSWLSPETRGRIFKAMLGSSGHTCCFFHVSSTILENLRTCVQKHAPQDTRLSMNDIITAYITIVVAQAKEKASADWWNKPMPLAFRSIFGSKQGEPRDYTVVTYVNMRSRINQPNIGKYMGNMAFGKGVQLSQDQIQEGPTDKVLATLALRIRQTISTTDEKYVGQFGNLLDKEYDNFLRLTMSTSKIKRKLMFSNQTRFAHYDVDFGAGIPAMVRHAPHAFVDLAYVMPANPTTGGYEIEFNLAPDVALHLIRNSSWMKLVDRYDCYI
ncbi:hypothetical protein IW138_005254 [Coemansia sp. RSA 986]|nr:hypothetical protein IW138_005254 [Coemansia sp. RSA 986]